MLGMLLVPDMFIILIIMVRMCNIDCLKSYYPFMLNRYSL